MTWRKHIARQPVRQPSAAASQSKAAPAPSPTQRVGNNGMQQLYGNQKFAGVVLGTNRNKEHVTVKREIGDGYGDRWQATAVARIAKAEPAAVALMRDGKWHAFETSAAFTPGRVSDDAASTETIAKGGTVLEVFGIPSLSTVNGAKGVDARAAAILGVPEGDIHSTINLAGRAPNAINIVGRPESGSPGGGHAPVGGETGFEEGKDTAFWLDVPELDKERAAETLFHEDQHRRDWDLAQTWIKTYTSETRHLFVKSAVKPFADWLHAQVKKKRLSSAEAELVLMEIADVTAYTEANANVRSFLADLEAGASELARKSLVGYAHALKPKAQGGGGQYGSPAKGSEVVAALTRELKSAYEKMPRDMRRQYDAAVAAAKIENPDAWISVLDFSNR